MTDRDKSLIESARKLAETAVTAAGKYLVSHKQSFTIKAYKDLQDIVTTVDEEAETMIIGAIGKTYPDHNIFSEEIGQIDKGSPYTWVIDPLDGTKEYIRDIPLYCSAVMLEKKGEPVASAIYDPELDELYSAGAGQGATLNHLPIHVSSQADLKQSMLFTYLPRNTADAVKLAPIFDLAYRIRGHANHNLSYCWVAKGGYEGHFSLFAPQHWWDIAPGILILRESGGRVTNLKGENISHQNFTSDAIGTNGKIHSQLLAASQKIFS